jgi:trk system potassium uptake protein
MLNIKMILYVMGLLLLMEGTAMALSIPISLYYNESDLWGFIYSCLITFGIGGLLWLLFKNCNKTIGKREGYIIVSSVWIVFSFFGALPFYISSSIPSFTDAYFETMSGFTTTGASILNNIEEMPHGILLWRSMTQWLGGMGIIVLSIAILPILGIGGMQLFLAEVPGPTKDKIHPKVKETARRLYIIYIAFTFLQTLFLLWGDMGLFDAINHSLTTMSSGGYSTKQASIAHFQSAYIEYVITFFMLIAGINFTLSYFAMHFKFKKLWTNEEFRGYLFIIFSFTVALTTILIFTTNFTFEESFRASIFQVVSLCTTTGFGTVDYLQWIPVATLLCFMLMFFGGCAGSTSGGMKVVRVLLLAKNSYLELKRLIHPNAIIPVRLNEKVVAKPIVTNILAFIVFYIVIFVFGTIFMSSLNIDIETSMGSVAATLGNIGPGIGKVGPSENFSFIPDIGKWFLSFLMMIGRLELFTVLILFTPMFWKR